MRLGDRAAELKAYMQAFDDIAAGQYDANPLLVTTAVSGIKTQLLESNGVLDKLAAAISSNSLSSGVSAQEASLLNSAFQPLTPDDFSAINNAILQRSSTSSVTPAVAGLSKAQTVEQAFGKGAASSFEFILRLSQPAPSGGAVFLLNYEGAARYGIDYSIDGLAQQPRYLHRCGAGHHALLAAD
jgi:hypothetical protein